VAAADGSEVLRVVMDRQAGVEAEALGRKIAAELLRQGAERLLGMGEAGTLGSETLGPGPAGAA
jgi:porphobilinogen deaminase